jgi:hypothetical protein
MGMTSSALLASAAHWRSGLRGIADDLFAFFLGLSLRCTGDENR